MKLSDFENKLIFPKVHSKSSEYFFILRKFFIESISGIFTHRLKFWKKGNTHVTDSRASSFQYSTKIMRWKKMLPDTITMHISIRREKYCTVYYLYGSRHDTDGKPYNTYVRVAICIRLGTIKMVILTIFLKSSE